MASQVALAAGGELLEMDMIWDAGICCSAAGESGVFLNSGGASPLLLDGVFQQWSGAAAAEVRSSSLRSSAAQQAQQVPDGRTTLTGGGTGSGTIASSSSAGQSATAAGSTATTETDGYYYRDEEEDARAPRTTSIVDRLLVELYDTYSGGGNRASVDSSTEASSSEAFLGRSNTGSNFLQELLEKHTRRHQMNYLAQKAPAELRAIIQEVKYRTGLQSAKLLRQLKRRDRLFNKLQKNYDIITACLQAVSQKRRVDTRLKFTIEPPLGKNGFQQWYDALKSVARLSTGIPKEWRKRVWLTLADQYLHSISIDWEKTLRFAFNERSNPDDDSLGIQIVKDLHRTGCSSYCGQEGEQDRVVLKRVLLAYARWNKTVGYCQGFNVLAALILEVTEGNESDALKVMIYLIDKVLPESYFANNLRALSVDMAVFRDLLRLKLPRLSQHLHHLQKTANREAGGSYEPPLTNVFTMQWFLTMFATCLPPPTVLKIWDSVFFEGSEVLLRVALAIWERLGERIEYCQTADEFYSTMGRLTQEMLEHDLIHPTDLMQEVYTMAIFPFPQLAELREKYTYNITPFPTSSKSNGSGGLGSWDSEDDADMDDEDSVVTALGCLGPLGGLLAPELQRHQKPLKDERGEKGNIAELSPGAVGAGGGGGGGRGGGRAEHQAAINSMMTERMSTDITALKKQYVRIKRRQQQQAMQLYIRTDKCPATSVMASQLNSSTPVVNHLLLGRKPRGGPRVPRPTSTTTPTTTLPGAWPSPLPDTQGSPARHQCGSLPSQAQTSSSGGMGSPWRAHVRAHRRNVARARSELGFADSEERGDDEGGGGMEREEGREEERVEEEKEGNDDDDEEKRELPLSPSPSPDTSITAPASEEEKHEIQDEDVSRVEMRLASLELEAELESSSPTHAHPNPDTNPVSPPGDLAPPERHPEPEPEPPVPILPPPPSSDGCRESQSFHTSAGCLPSSPHLSSSVSTSRILTTSPSPPSPGSFRVSASPSTPNFSPLALHLTSSPSTPSLSSSCVSSSPSNPALSSCSSSSTSPAKHQIFSPFPSVKQPRKSLAARNLGLYGPTSRTPTVHFPQLSLNRSITTTTTRRR